MSAEAYAVMQQQKYRHRIDNQLRQRWQQVNDQLTRPFPLEWLPLDWEDVKPIEEDSVVTVRAQALERMDPYL